MLVLPKDSKTENRSFDINSCPCVTFCLFGAPRAFLKPARKGKKKERGRKSKQKTTGATRAAYVYYSVLAFFKLKFTVVNLFLFKMQGLSSRYLCLLVCIPDTLSLTVNVWIRGKLGCLVYIIPEGQFVLQLRSQGLSHTLVNTTTAIIKTVFSQYLLRKKERKNHK